MSYYLIGYTHRVISDKVHRLLVTLSYFRPDRFVQLLSLINLTLIFPSLNRSSVYWFLRVSGPEGEQLYSKFNSNCSVGETLSKFRTYK